MWWLLLLVARPAVGSQDWDLLIFTQHWPSTVCLQYEESGADHVCVRPKTQDSWTVHGVWPTKLHTIGPGFCDPTIKFDPARLAPIRAELDNVWPNLEEGKGEASLWSHEWLKHGTCAISLPQLDSEEKYFQQGVEWFQQYNMTTILANSGVVPSDTHEYPVESFQEAVLKATGINPNIQCVLEHHTKKPYLFEIRICFDKSLALMDCDGTKLGRAVHTNCPPGQTILYPRQVPPLPQAPRVPQTPDYSDPLYYPNYADDYPQDLPAPREHRTKVELLKNRVPSEKMELKPEENVLAPKSPNPNAPCDDVAIDILEREAEENVRAPISPNPDAPCDYVAIDIMEVEPEETVRAPKSPNPYAPCDDVAIDILERKAEENVLAPTSPNPDAPCDDVAIDIMEREAEENVLAPTSPNLYAPCEDVAIDIMEVEPEGIKEAPKSPSLSPPHLEVATMEPGQVAISPNGSPPHLEAVSPSVVAAAPRVEEAAPYVEASPPRLNSSPPRPQFSPLSPVAPPRRPHCSPVSPDAPRVAARRRKNPQNRYGDLSITMKFDMPTDPWSPRTPRSSRPVIPQRPIVRRANLDRQLDALRDENGDIRAVDFVDMIAGPTTVHIRPAPGPQARGQRKPGGKRDLVPRKQAERVLPPRAAAVHMMSATNPQQRIGMCYPNVPPAVVPESSDSSQGEAEILSSPQYNAGPDSEPSSSE